MKILVTPEEYFRNPELMDRVPQEAARQAIRQHQRTGLPMIVVREGQVVAIPADEHLLARTDTPAAASHP